MIDRFTLFLDPKCRDKCKELSQEIDEIIDQIERTGIDYAVIPVEGPVMLWIRSSGHIEAVYCSRIKKTLTHILDEKKYLH